MALKSRLSFVCPWLSDSSARPGDDFISGTLVSCVWKAALLRQLSFVQGLCESWPGPLSIAFYTAIIADGSSVDERVAAAVAAVNVTFQK